MLEKLAYDRYVEFMFDLFGRDNVHIEFYEDMRTDFQEFMRTMYAIVGVDEGHVPDDKPIFPASQKVSPSQAWWLSWFNKFTLTVYADPTIKIPRMTTYSKMRKRVISWINRFVKVDKKPDVKSLLDEKTRQLIQASNRRLVEILGQDISVRGYDCG